MEGPGENNRVLETLGIRVVRARDPDFPENLRTIENSPPLLYVQGEIRPLDSAAVSIVGSRHASHYGFETARRLAFDLASAGMTIVSGLAHGIDSAAHEGALQARGRTLAVLGCGLDVPYPRGKEELRRRILLQGALLSEYPLGTLPRREHFPVRNRLISGLSLGVVVVEAHAKSGSLITARLALEQGREVFAVPGRIDSPTSVGPHRLIKEGACLVESAEDILRELAPRLSRFALFEEKKACESVTQVISGEDADERKGEEPLSSEPEASILALLKKPHSAEEILVKTGLPVHLVQSSLSRLEVKRKIQRGNDGCFRRSHHPPLPRKGGD